MAFASNPLSLSVPEAAFESWLRDSGYLELLDHRTTELHRLHSASASTATAISSASLPNSASTTAVAATPTTTVTAILYLLIMSVVSSLATFLSLFTLNPFAKLASADFSDHNAAPWTAGGFLGCADCYSFPSSPTQARMRVHENVKRFARNYATLLILFFACALYQMPLALVGLLSCLAVWEAFRFFDDKWSLDRFPTIRQVLVRIGQCGFRQASRAGGCVVVVDQKGRALVGAGGRPILCAVAVILLCSNVQMAVFSALAVGYAVMMLHASFRKLTPAKQSSKGRGR
ncbi:hypothetical protein Cgig2_008788 [Carnegiea gigantea]|uniref:PRA1 family protein n=1 Tax=Carnegiea gigantea TaxID=171969 RepID=A0A9Q1JL20_9CARY|nr:hypothetical protein Cgig2_008788 [Carnegiea gigantea]